MPRSKQLPIVTLLTLSFVLALPSIALSKEASSGARSDSIWVGSYGRLHNWKAVSRNEVVLWTSPLKAYLVTVRTPFNGLRFAQTIGVTSFAGRIGKFDSILVNGWRLPIESIVKIDRETAKSLRWRSAGQQT